MFEPGITALLGPNGAGKSTLMRTLVTDLRPRAGEVVLAGGPVRTRVERLEARASIGYLPQGFGFDGRFTVGEYVEYLAWLRAVPARSRRAAVARAVDVVGLGGEVGTRMGRLSGGMRQRAGIAGAIVGEPRLLVLDEPTVGLDPAQRAGFRRVLTRLEAPRVVLSTHLTDDVTAVAHHVVVLAGGHVRFAGHLAEMLDRFGSVEAGYLALVDDGSAVVS
ncbi:ATP-binding cassette domain-containing protein [Xylanimonas sp. McL0601]|uniref:ATP-binding cassette domain-containing protein n=1 Tax=Xylanimonas sp. McL0601 TaxID=3414739 RepID=UPI003CF4C374